jgi:hypothetical protein
LEPADTAGLHAHRHTHYYQLTWAGLCELDKQTGNITRRFPDLDRDAAGETILMTDKLLLTISNRAVTAYALDTSEAEAAP